MINRLLAIMIAATLSVQIHATSRVLSQFQADAPSDTIFYAEASLAMLSNTGAASLVQGSQVEQFLDMFDRDESLNRSPESKFLIRLVEDYAARVAEGPKKLTRYYGLSANNEFAVYLEGMAPVMHIAVRNPNAIRDLLIQYSEESGVKYQSETWMKTPAFVWKISPKKGVNFSVVFEKKRVTLGFYLDADTEERKFRRLGLIKETSSVANKNIMANLQKQYGFVEVMQGYLNLVELARVGLQLADNSLSQDLKLLNPNPSAPLTKACRDEFMTLAESVPRLVMGYDEVRTRGSQVHLQASTILEIKDAEAITVLSQLNGHLSELAMGQNGQIFSLAMGLDADQLSYVVTHLWTRLINSEFECGQLIELQASAEASNPATVAIFAAMAQGLQGVSLSVFDLEITDIENFEFTLDALVTLSSEKPELLAGLLANIPQLKGLQLPVDGSEYPVTSLGLAPEKTPSMAIRGDHLAMFIGDTSRRISNKLVDEKLNHQGLFGMTFDYKKFYDLLSDSLLATPELTIDMDATTCAQVYSSILPLSALDATATIMGGFNESGFVSDINVDMAEVANQPIQSVVGEYHLEQLTDGCAWELVGEEIMKKNGTGNYSVSDVSGQCLIYGSDYQWSQNGARVSFDITHSESRETCDDSFIPDDVSNYDCIIVDQNAGGFSCMFSYDDDYQEIYRYLKK